MSKKTAVLRALSHKIRLGAPSLVVAGVTIVVAGVVAMRSNKPEVEINVDSTPEAPSKA